MSRFDAQIDVVRTAMPFRHEQELEQNFVVDFHQDVHSVARALPHCLRIMLPDGSISRYKGRSIEGGLRHDQAIENVARPIQV